ncbi:MAG: tetratricopeptide repeat protein [Alphaproteobacteria bacterium]
MGKRVRAPALWAVLSIAVGVAPAQATPPCDPSAISGDLNAMTEQGLAYETGQGVAKDEMKAAALYREAADKNYAPAQRQLAALYLRGAGGLPKDDQAAFQLLEKATRQNDVLAQMELARLYDEGRGGPKDTAKAKRIRADVEMRVIAEEARRQTCEEAEKGSARAQLILGRVLLNGDEAIGISKSEETAAGWFQKAALQGNGAAQFELGISYEAGRGVPVDNLLALTWYETAARGGSDDVIRRKAREKSAALKQKMNSKDVDEAENRAATFVPRTP